jgi:hypothetical protein
MLSAFHLFPRTVSSCPCNSFASSCWEGQRQLVKYISEAQMYSITMPLYKMSILSNLNLKPHFPLQRCHAVGVMMSNHKHLVQVRTSLNGRFSYAIWKKHHPSWSCVKISELGTFNLHIVYWHAFDALNYVQKNRISSPEWSFSFEKINYSFVSILLLLALKDITYHLFGSIGLSVYCMLWQSYVKGDNNRQLKLQGECSAHTMDRKLPLKQHNKFDNRSSGRVENTCFDVPEIS